MQLVSKSWNRWRRHKTCHQSSYPRFMLPNKQPKGVVSNGGAQTGVDAIKCHQSIYPRFTAKRGRKSSGGAQTSVGYCWKSTVEIL
ncbi:36488_t:CDS:2 [Racocetra persica]|uniref:36488_t:CDS:1 n=1 Tax=Racocetra persica TaxID=160502 RepID=A0ACA9KCK3_9GLOM|nr:36488_t:CDS:2 [Racocetra persica]